MRDDVIDRAATAQENRCRRAARAFAWWGRIAGALWIFEAVVSGPIVLAKAPIWLLTFASELLSPGVRRGDNLGPAAGLQTVGVVICAYLFWFAADGIMAGDPGRVLGITFALFVLGARSTCLTLSAWHHAPRENPGRTPRIMRNHRRVARAVLLSGVPWASLLLFTGLAGMGDGETSHGLKILVLGGLGLAAAVHFSRLAVRGAAVRFSVPVTAVASILTIAVGATNLGAPGAWVLLALGMIATHVAAVMLLATTAGGGERPLAPWEEGRVADE